MPKKDYTKPLATARRLVEKFGKLVTFIELGDTPTDTDKPWEGQTDKKSDPKQTQALNAVFVEPESSTKLGIENMNDDLMTRTDKILIVEPNAAGDIKLEQFNQVIDTDDSTWNILFVRTLRPADVTLLFFVGVAR